MSVKKILGDKNEVVTSVSFENGDREAAVVTIEGAYDHIENTRASLILQNVPAGYTEVSNTISSTGDGMGKIVVRCVKYNANGSTFSSERTTFRIDMQEVQHDLEDHPAIADDRDIIIKWLATEESKRIKDGNYYYKDENDNLVKVEDQDVYAEMFITAYMSGIKSFFRYYPVIECIGIYKNPPGITRYGKSFTSGSPEFSAGIGTYSDPPISLAGYPKGHWFKSKDSWVNNSDKTWTRTEQWTYTPEKKDDINGWIYTDL